MSLRKNSSDLIKILSNNPERLKKINLLNDEEKIYNYIKDEIISDYTKEDFNEFKCIISNLDKIYSKNNAAELNEKSLNNVSGGFLKDFEDFSNSFLSGFNDSGVKRKCDTINKVVPKFIQIAEKILKEDENK